MLFISECICVCINFTYIQDKTVHIYVICVRIYGTYAQAGSLMVSIWFDSLQLLWAARGHCHLDQGRGTVQWGRFLRLGIGTHQPRRSPPEWTGFDVPSVGTYVLTWVLLQSRPTSLRRCCRGLDSHGFHWISSWPLHHPYCRLAHSRCYRS